MTYLSAKRVRLDPWGARREIALALTVLLAACSDPTTADDGDPASSTSNTLTGQAVSSTSADSGTADSTTGSDPPTVDYAAPGPHPVGNVQITVLDAAGDRELPVEIWYPATEAAAADADDGRPLAEFESEPQRTQLADLVAAAPPQCTRPQTRSAPDAAPADGPFPLVVMSHCHQCTRYSLLTIVERLASHGFAVAAPDHIDNTVFNGIAGTGVGVTPEFLTVRSTDIIRVLDVMLDSEAAEVPKSLRGSFDPARVGMLGHSFGAVTTGRVLQDDDRVRAAVVIAAPVENPLFPSVTTAGIDEPLLMMLAQEDNSIGELGNTLLRGNFESAAPPVWLVEFADAGHWSFSDICDLVDDLQPGCGNGMRQTRPGTQFTYLDNELARSTAATYTTRFFAAQLLADAEADAALDVAEPSDIITVSVRRD